MHEMWNIATDIPVVWCICRSVACLQPAKMAERIEVMFAVETLGDPSDIGEIPVFFPDSIQCVQNYFDNLLNFQVLVYRFSPSNNSVCVFVFL